MEGVVKHDPEVLNEDLVLKKFAQLWFACYFERRLTKQKVEETDLSVIVKDLIGYFRAQTVDFKRAIPLLHGLHILFTRKMSYLLKDSEAMLQQMKNPIGELIKVEEPEEGKANAGESPEKSKAKRKPADPRF